MNRISSCIAKHPVVSLAFYLFAVCAIGCIGVEIVQINIRFAMMTSEIADHPLGLFPTLNGQPYADYPSLYNILAYLASGGGRWVNRFTLALPTILFSCYVVVMTAKTSELIKPGSGLCAALFSLLSYESVNIFMAFSIDMPVAAAAVTIVWSMLKFDFGLKALITYVAMLFLAFAVRGPLGVILCGAVTAGVIIGARRWKSLIVYGVTGAATGAACLGLAYLAILRQGGDELWQVVKEWQVASRMGKKNVFSYLYYFTNAMVSFLPVSILMEAALVMKRRELIRPKLAMPLLWMLLPMVILSIPGCKHLRYMAPMLPAFAICAAIGYLEADRSWAGRLLDFLVTLMDKLALPVGLALIATGVAMGILMPSYRISLFLHLAVALALLLSVYFLLRRRTGKPWPLVRIALTLTLLVGIACTSGFALWENSSFFVGRVEKLAAEQGGTIYLYDLNPDHDDLKVMYHLSPEMRRNMVTIYQYSEKDSEHLKKMFPVISPEQAFAEIRPCDVVVLHRKKLKYLKKDAETAGLQIVMLDEKGRLGHKKSVAVRLLKVPTPK